MEQYIPKSVLIAEIERLIEINKVFKNSWKWKFKWFYRTIIGRLEVLEGLKNFIDTLEVKEVDLKKALESWRHNHFHGRRDKDASGEYLERDSQLDLAKHFFELGLKSKSSYVGIPNIDDTLKEMGVDPDSKSAESFKEFYYMALEKFKAQKGE